MLRAGGHSPWFARPPEKGAPRRVFCFSFAGGNASTYRSWQALAGARAEICAIQLPGAQTGCWSSHWRPWPML